MFRRIVPLLLVILSVLLDVSAVPVFVQSYFMPLITLCTVIALGLLLGRTQGTLYGLIGGMLLDVLVNEPIGLMLMLYLSCGYIAGIAGRKFHQYLLMPIVTAIICFFIVELTMLIYLFLCAVEFDAAFFTQVGIRMVVETLLVQILYLFYNQLIKPRTLR